jgi:hypothetical protein
MDKITVDVPAPVRVVLKEWGADFAAAMAAYPDLVALDVQARQNKPHVASHKKLAALFPKARCHSSMTC